MTTTNTTPTLDQINAWMATRPASVTEWNGWRKATSYAVGKAGGQNARRGALGAKVHLLTVETVLARPEDARPDTFKVGATSGVRGCNGNGQFTGIVVPGARIDQITCTKCLTRLARLVERMQTEQPPTPTPNPTATPVAPIVNPVHLHAVNLTDDEFNLLTEALQTLRDNRVDDLNAGAEQMDAIRSLDSVAQKFNITLDGSEDGVDDRCPGCGCLPGDGRTPGCAHLDGCGYADEVR